MIVGLYVAGNIGRDASRLPRPHYRLPAWRVVALVLLCGRFIIFNLVIDGIDQLMSDRSHDVIDANGHMMEEID
jgi:hypothetical protein